MGKPDTTPERSNQDLERIVLGAALLSADSLLYVVENSKVDDFSTPANRTLLARLAMMYGEGRSVDRNTLLPALKLAGELSKVGGETYVRSLESAVPFGDYDIASLSGLLREFTVARKLVALGDQIRNQAISGTRSEDILTQAEAYLRSLGEYSDDRGNLLDTDELVARAGGIDRFIDPYEGNPGIQTPWRELNEAIVGIHAGEMLTIGASTSRGKSVMAAQIAHKAAVNGTLTAYFSHEMTGDQIVRRLAYNLGKIIAADARAGRLTPEEKDRFKFQIAQIAEPQLLHTCDVRGRDVLQVAAEIRTLQARRKKRVGLVVVDHIQLMRGRRSSYSNRTQELTEISGDLKAYALDNGLAMICLSQLNRQPSKRTDGRPTIDDLRESGSISADSDNVWLIHWPQFCDPNDRTLLNKIILILAKLREGEIRDVELKWNGAYLRFENRPEAA
jgi:replicative DNA helicase